MLLGDIQDTKDRHFSCHFPLNFGSIGAVRSASVALCPSLSAYKPFIQRMFTGHLLRTNHCSRSWEYSSEQD